jgi:holo-ACP synthase
VVFQRWNSKVKPEQILISREKRAEHQRYLMNLYGATLASFTMNIPGDIKLSPAIIEVFLDGIESVYNTFQQNNIKILFFESRLIITGPEAYFCIACPAIEAKKMLCIIEEQHKAGRLFDLDVIGTNYRKISRSDIGYPKRRCLVCESDAYSCARSGRHDMKELINAIDKIILDWIKEKHK